MVRAKNQQRNEKESVKLPNEIEYILGNSHYEFVMRIFYSKCFSLEFWENN